MIAMTLSLTHDHVAFRVVDYDATVAWYTEKLDFTVDQEWPFEDLELAYLSNGSAKIEVLGGSAATPQTDPTDLGATFGHEGLHHFCIALPDLDAIVAELQGRGVEFVGEAFVVEEIARRLAFIKDNSGNLIELSAPR
jgi:glyoxylase I family protein